MNILNFFKFIISELSELRWRIVPLICSLSVGSMYVYDFPGSFGMNTDGNQKQDSIQALFEKHGKQYTNTMNELLYSVYNYPNMLLCLIGGIVLDKVLGLRLGTVVFSFLVTLGSLLFWLGIKYVSFPLMVTGRTIYGLGGESLCVAQNAFLVKWFHGAPTLGVAFTLMVLFGRVGSALNFLITPRAAASSGVAWAACTGTLVCAGSTLIALFLFLLDRTFESPSQKNLPSEVNVTDCEKDSESLIAKEKIKYHHLPLTLWFMAISCALFYNSVMPFNSFAIPFFVQNYGITDIQSAADVSLFQLVSAISSPCMGLLYDLTGRGCFRLLVAPIFIAGSYIAQLFLPTSAAASMVWMALNYSLYASTIWPSVPPATTPEQRGIAYGLISATQNTAGSTIPVGIGALLDKYTVRTTNLDSTTSAKGYHIVLILLAVVACVSALFSALLWVQDSRTTKKINAGRRTTDCDAQP